MGRTIGFPTMNVSWNLEAAPAYGVYAGQVKHLNNSVQLPAVTNYGMRPTLENDVQIPILEKFTYLKILTMLGEVMVPKWKCHWRNLFVLRKS